MIIKIIIVIPFLLFGCINGGVDMGRATASQEVDIDRLVPCVIQVESSGNPQAYNKSSGAIGLMQITPIVLEEFYQDGFGVIFEHQAYTLDIFHKEDLYCPYINRRIGEWYLKRIKDHYCKVWKIPATLENICIGYNWGIGNLKKWYKSGADVKKLPKETRDYIRKILALYNKGD